MESDYIQGFIEPTELKNSLYQLLVDVAEPIRFENLEKILMMYREHFQKEKKGFWAGFLKFFRGGKQQTASLADPN